MLFDTTAIGICLAIIACIGFAALEFHNNKDFEIGNIALVFLAIFAISSGIELIYAAIKGDPNNLPTNWREYLGVAGMVGIGLSINFVINAIKKTLKKTAPSKVSKQVSE